MPPIPPPQTTTVYANADDLPPGTIDCDLPCHNCGYNLKNLSTRHSNCPECGTLLIDSFQRYTQGEILTKRPAQLFILGVYTWPLWLLAVATLTIQTGPSILGVLSSLLILTSVFLDFYPMRKAGDYLLKSEWLDLIIALFVMLGFTTLSNIGYSAPAAACLLFYISFRAIYLTRLLAAIEKLMVKPLSWPWAWGILAQPMLGIMTFKLISPTLTIFTSLLYVLSWFILTVGPLTHLRHMLNHNRWPASPNRMIKVKIDSNQV